MADALAFNGSNLRRGSSGKHVKAAKERLFELGMYSTNIKSITSDVLGADSVEAIKRFQIKNGLEVDGVIGAITWAALFGVPVTTPTADAPAPTDGISAARQAALDQMLALCEEQVNNHSCYVWATSGELGTSVTEKYIRTKEARCNGGANANRAVNAWNAQLDAGNTLFRIFDCSGFVSWVLVKTGVFSGRRDCDGLWSLSNKLDKPENGALLFRVNSSNSEDETHVGLYFNGYQYHAKGRDVGVVKEKYSAKYWAKCARFKALEKL